MSSETAIIHYIDLICIIVFHFILSGVRINKIRADSGANIEVNKITGTIEVSTEFLTRLGDNFDLFFRFHSLF